MCLIKIGNNYFKVFEKKTNYYSFNSIYSSFSNTYEICKLKICINTLRTNSNN